MRKILLAGAALLAAGCSPNQSQESADGISPSSAPGIAWTYNYDFLLDDSRIEQVQERHAARCEQLGPDRCRITGLRYSVSEDENISAMLQVRLAPAVARQFGREALGDVRGADGKLVRSEFTGEDVGSGVAQARDAGADIRQQIADLQRRIEEARPGSPERAELQRQLEALKGQATSQRNIVSSGEQRLSFTPVTFNYYGDGGIPGFRENPFKAGFKLMMTSLVTMVSFVLQAVGLLLPWLLLFGLLALLWRSRPMLAVRRWWNAYKPPEGYRTGETQA